MVHLAFDCIFSSELRFNRTRKMYVVDVHRRIWNNPGRLYLAMVSRQFWDRTEPLLHYSDVDFLRNFRLTKDTVTGLVELMENDLINVSNRGKPLTPLQKICLTLSFLSNGSFMYTSGVMAGVKKTCTLNAIHKVVDTICAHAIEFMELPSPMEMRETANRLQRKYKIPDVALGVDGTFIRLERRPSLASLQLRESPQD